MDNLNPQDVVSNLEAKAIETANAAIEAKSVDFTTELEAKSAQINEVLEGKVDTAALELVQKSIDDLASEVKNLNTNTPETMPTNEFKSWLDSASQEVMESKNATATFEVKNTSTVSLSAAAANSTPSKEDRQSSIEFNPHQDTAAAYLSAKTGTGTSYRFSSATAATNNAGGKLKGAAFGKTSLGVADQQTPYITMGHILTVPREELADTVALENYFREDMRGYLVDTINGQILNGAGGADALKGIESWKAPSDQAGFETFFGSLADSYGTAANEIDVINAAVASFKGINFTGEKIVFVNPALIAKLQGIKGTDGHYQLQSTVDATGKVRSFLGGAELIEVPAVASGEFYIFDRSEVKFVTREGMKMEMGYTGDDWERNNVSLKIYGRFALVVGKPDAIQNGSFANAIAALNA
jgi:hypothetical protein